MGIGDWGLGIGDLGNGEWAEAPIPNPQGPNPHSPFEELYITYLLKLKKEFLIKKYKKKKKKIKLIKLNDNLYFHQKKIYFN